MKAYKGFNRDMTCTPNGQAFQFEVGKTYEEERAQMCEWGFHACEAPLDVLGYYPPGDGSVYHEVELDGVTDEKVSLDTKRCGTKITIGKRLSYDKLIAAQMRWAATNVVEEAHAKGDVTTVAVGKHGVAHVKEQGVAAASAYGVAMSGLNSIVAAGAGGIAKAQHNSVSAVGRCGVSMTGGGGISAAGSKSVSMTGNFGVSVSRGAASVEQDGIACARGNGCMVRGGLGSLLVIAEEHACDFGLVSWKAFVVDGDKIKPNTWYRLNNGEIEEVRE